MERRIKPPKRPTSHSSDWVGYASELESAGQYFECLLVLSAVLEQELSVLINTYESAAASYVDFLNMDLSRLHRVKMTLGEKVGIIEAYSDDKELIAGLKKFVEVRNEVTHDLLKSKPVLVQKKLEGQIGKYFESLIGVMKEATRIAGIYSDRVADAAYRKALNDLRAQGK